MARTRTQRSVDPSRTVQQAATGVSAPAASTSEVSDPSHLYGIELTWAERYDVLDAWETVLDGLYAHLPLKRSLYGYDPIRALEHLRRQTPEMTSLQFHRELTALINRLRDAHTQYTGPKRLAESVASLPFLIEAFGPPDAPQYLVTKVSRMRTSTPHFQPGVTLLWWNGVPFDRAVDLHAEVETGGRPDARRARALESMTLRALGYAPPPDEKWVDIGYRDLEQRERRVRFEWTLVEPGRSPRASQRRTTRVKRALNPAAEAVRRAKKYLFNHQLWLAEREPLRATEARGKRATGYEDFLSAGRTPSGQFGYLRIWSFDVDDDGGFLAAATKLLRRLPDTGLVIDLRDNPGGFIWAAERMLQLFTPNRIVPTKFALRATPTTTAMARAAFNAEDLGPWASSLGDAADTGEPYSRHLPITSIDQCNDVGPIYGGPVVVIVDANTYSSGDLFTAGVVDNRIGPVVCVGSATGGGGANVWTSDDVHDALEAARMTGLSLPQGTSFTIAIRRAVRSGDAEGVLIEDAGIHGQQYAMTRQDVLGRNDDLLRHCEGLLESQPWTRLNVSVKGRALSITTDGLERLDIFCDGHPARSTVVVTRDGTRSINVASPGVIEVVGYEGDLVRQRRRVTVR